MFHMTSQRPDSLISTLEDVDWSRNMERTFQEQTFQRNNDERTAE